MDNMVLGILNDSALAFHISELSEIINNDIYKVLVFDMQAHDHFSEYAKTNGLLIKHHSYDKCFDIVPTECNKYLGVLPFISEFANEDIFVFGNDYNDYELFKHFKNSTLFGEIKELQQITKLNLQYDEYLGANFEVLINTILG
jgi:hydroxymethylpyrimidine pyrophosphatase-like HAD family hydrolase